MKPICIIPASGASTRFPRKNLALLNGKPLMAYAIEAARDSGVFDEVYVSSEDEEVLWMAAGYKAVGVPRPIELASDRAQIRHVCMHILDIVPCDAFGVLGIPNPLRIAEDVREAYRIFKQADAECLMSVSEYSHPPQRAVWMPDGFIEPYFGRIYMKRAQMLDRVYRCDGSIIFVKTEAFRRVGDFYGTNAISFVTPKGRSADIDYSEDLEWVKWKLDCGK